MSFKSAIKKGATLTVVECMFLQGWQLLYFTQNRLLPTLIQGSLCFSDWSWKEIVCMSDIIRAILGKEKGKRTLEKGLSDDED
jgi:hypothetical protein